ncbi:MAG: UDP-3-O-acyl-N-acetylglucosamine deacetylase, partial [Muribaculaceae bacterium]|nr:UDP-3-O-acyl-N-acetylglucosamine deacetylase [Muribaculaceae bacterium]
MNQLTLTAPIELSCKGVHSGEYIKATFKPAPDNHGYKFKRID